MFKFFNKKFILDTSSGVCHSSTNITKNCQIYQIEPSNIFFSDHLHEEIKSHPHYRKKCSYCMIDNYLELYDFIYCH